MMREKTTPASLGGDLTGGLLAGLMSLPAAMAYGVLVFAPLGPQLASAGVVAGLVGMAMLNLASAPIAGNKILSCSPGAPSALMAAATLPGLMKQVQQTPGVEDPLFMTMVLMFAAMALSGVFQYLVGLLRLGGLAKFVPYPVTAGLLTGTGILILKSQLYPVLGIQGGEQGLPDALWASVVVAAVTVASMVVSGRVTRKVPAPVVGLVIGTAAYYLMAAIFSPESLGKVVGSIPGGIPTPRYLGDMVHMVMDGTNWIFAPTVVTLAFGLAVVNSLDTLVAGITGDTLSGTRSDFSKELKAQGIGNLITAVFGGLIGVGSASRTAANFQYGGRTVRSRVVTGIFALAVLLVIAPIVAMIPVVVLAALLVMAALGLIDRWSLATLNALLRGRTVERQTALSNLTVMVSVAVLMLSVGVIEGVAVGLLLSLFYFVARMGKHAIRRRYGGDTFHSNTQRPAAEFEQLQAAGQQIQVFELEGSLFFGTADAVLETIENELREERFAIILDLSLVAEVDITGARLLVRTAQLCEENDVKFLLCYPPEGHIGQYLKDLGVLATVRKSAHFQHVNDALDLVEDLLLDQLLGSGRYEVEHDLGDIDALFDFSEEQLERLKKYLTKYHFESGDGIFSQGDKGDKLYFITRGQVRIDTTVQGTELQRRIATLCAGTLLGEMAIIDKRPRSATASAEGPVDVWEFNLSQMEHLEHEYPALMYKFLKGLSYEISTRLRIANRRPR